MSSNPFFLHFSNQNKTNEFMADNHAVSCLLGMMDCLWFHHPIIISPKRLLQPSSSSLSSSSSSSSMAVPEGQQLSSNNSSAITNGSETQIISEDNFSSSIVSSQDEDSESEEKERTTKRLHLSGRKTRLSISSLPSSLSSSCSSCGSMKKARRSYVYPFGSLNKSMSCKSLCELELEEVQGFMDLGFTFDKQNLNKRMMSVIPGLQRLHLYRNNAGGDDDDDDDDDRQIRKEIEGEESQPHEPRVVNRPYLSEAWLIKRPDSPLLNLKIPSVSTAADMKKHLKCWAKTVASTVQPSILMHE